MKILILFLTMAIIVFIFFWLLNIKINSNSNIKTREWLKNFPSWNDPERYERFKKEKENESNSK
jgi:hypothetical protein